MNGGKPNMIVDPGAQQTIGIATAVELFVVMNHHGDDVRFQAHLAEQNVSRMLGMPFHRPPLAVVQFSRFIQDFQWNHGFADIVQQRAPARPTL